MANWRDSVIGRMDWGNWIYGLAAAFIGGGASSISTGFAVSIVDPKDFVLFGPKSLHVMWITFCFNGVLIGCAFLKQNPLPAIRTVTTVETITHQPASPTVVKTTIEETKVGPPSTP